MKKAIVGMLMAALASWVLFPSLGYSTAEFGKKEKVACTKCHVKAGDKVLNPCGEAYKKSQKLGDPACK